MALSGAELVPRVRRAGLDVWCTGNQLVKRGVKY